MSAKAKRALKASATKTEPPASRKQSAVKGGFTAQSARSLGAKKVEAKPAQGLTGTPTKKRDAKALEKEKSSAKKMTDKEFLKFCAEVQSAGVTSAPKAKAVDPITAEGQSARIGCGLQEADECSRQCSIEEEEGLMELKGME